MFPKINLNIIANFPEKHYCQNPEMIWQVDLNLKGREEGGLVEEAVPLVEAGLTNRDFEKGKMMYAAGRCSSCHIMRGDGGNIGPDLTQLGNAI